MRQRSLRAGLEISPDRHEALGVVIRRQPDKSNCCPARLRHMHYLIHLSLLLLPMLCFCGLGAHAESGIASVYAGVSRTKGELTAAHRTLPLGTRVRVRNRKTGASVLVVVNDRGPFVRGRVIDLSSAAARALGFSGTTFVDVDRASQLAHRHPRESRRRA